MADDEGVHSKKVSFNGDNLNYDAASTLSPPLNDPIPSLMDILLETSRT